jgi:hypothetical protein
LDEREEVTMRLLVESKFRYAGELDKDVVSNLFKKGLIYIDVPVEEKDCFSGTASFVAVFPRGLVAWRVQGNPLDAMCMCFFFFFWLFFYLQCRRWKDS